MMWLFSERTEMGLSSGTGRPIFTAPCVLALGTLESDHLEKLQARPDITAFSHNLKMGAVSTVLIAVAIDS